MKNEFTIAFKMRMRNGVLQKFIESNNYTIKSFAEAVGIGYQSILEYLNLKYYPKKENRLKISNFIGKDESEVFPDFLNNKVLFETKKDGILYKNVSPSYINELKKREIESPQETLERHELKKAIKEILETLTTKEAAVIKCHFGLDGEQPLTLKEIGKKFSLTQERIRQIEKKAISKLRHPSRKNIFLKYGVL